MASGILGKRPRQNWEEQQAEAIAQCSEMDMQHFEEIPINSGHGIAGKINPYDQIVESSVWENEGGNFISHSEDIGNGYLRIRAGREVERPCKLTRQRLPNDWNGLLWKAANEGDISHADFYLQKGVSPDVCEENGVSALLAAVSHNHVDMVRLLISRGVFLNYQDAYGFCALKEASANGYHDIVGILLSSGADVDLRDIHGRTALTHAVGSNQVEVVKLLLRFHADPNARDHSGFAPDAYAPSLRIRELLFNANVQYSVGTGVM